MTTSDCPTITIDDFLFAAIGAELCSFLAPRDLLSLSLSNRNLSKSVRENAFDICLKQLGNSPAADDGQTAAAASVVISKKHSFAARDDLAEHLMEKIEVANLRYNPRHRIDYNMYTDTLEETLALARESIGDESQWRCCSWRGTFRSDPADEARRTSAKKGPFGVGCRFEEQLLGGVGFPCNIDWKLRELGQGGDVEANHCAAVREWARFILAQRDVVGREWHWECDEDEGIGFMIYAPEGGERLEIRLTKRRRSQNLKPLTFSQNRQTTFS